MKKFLLISALAVATMANASGFETSKLHSYGADSKKIETVGSFEWKDAKTFMQEHSGARAAQAAAYDLADYYYAPGSFHLGIYEGIGSYNYGMILFPFLDSVIYYNYYGPTNWFENNNLYAEATDTYVTGYGINGMYYVPETADHDFNPKRDWGEDYKDTTLNVKGTLYGNGTSGQFVCSAIESKFINGENLYMTLCAMETDTMTDETDFWRVGGGITDDVYLNGTGVHLEGSTETADTLGILVDNRGLMKIEQILFPIYGNNKTAANGLIPDGAKLRVILFPFDEDRIHFEDTIASTEVSNADLIGGAASFGYYGTLHAKFFETDIFGTETETPIWVDGNFYLQLTNFNETGCDFGFFSDFYCPVTATTIYQHDGKFSFRGGRGGGGNYGQNLGISFDAYWPTLVNDNTINVLYAGVEAESVAHFGDDENDNRIILYSNVNPDEWEVETDADWLSYDYTSDYYEQDGTGLMMFMADALPEGEEGRVATVSVVADGAVQEFIIVQGNASPEGIENTVADKVIKGTKTLIDGQLVIERNGVRYNATGAQISK